MVSSAKKVPHRHGPHLNHLPADLTFVVLVGLLMPVTAQLQVEHVIHGLLIGCLCLFLPT